MFKGYFGLFHVSDDLIIVGYFLNMCKDVFPHPAKIFLWIWINKTFLEYCVQRILWFVPCFWWLDYRGLFLNMCKDVFPHAEKIFIWINKKILRILCSKDTLVCSMFLMTWLSWVFQHVQRCFFLSEYVSVINTSPVCMFMSTTIKLTSFVLDNKIFMKKNNF